MKYWRITKYNPKFRDENGTYTKKEWTDFSDIGRVFDGIEFTADKYFSIEKAYVEAVKIFLNKLHICQLKIEKLELDYDLNDICSFAKKYPNEYSDDMLVLFKNIKYNDVLPLKDIEYVIKLILRNHLWGVLKCSNLITVRFGWDFYMYVCSSVVSEEAISKIVSMGLFVEDFYPQKDDEWFNL